MSSENLKNKSIAIVTHVFATGPAQELKFFLKNKTKELVFIGHPFFYAQDRRSFYQHYRGGVLTQEKYAFNWELPEILCWFKDVLYTIFWLLKFKGRFDFYIGANNLNTFTGLFVKKCKKTKKVIFYTIDYVPARFRNKMLNNIYHWIDRYCVQHCDKSWNLSEKMSVERKRKGIRDDTQIVVPIGVHFNRIQRISLEEIDKNRIVYMGHLRQKQGLELIIEALPTVVKEITDLKLIIIGEGKLRDILENRARQLQIDGYIEFKGYIPDHKDVERILTTCAIGLAPYEPDINSFTWYADPSKPKQYMASGLPIIITKVAKIAEEIQKRPMGIVINYDKDELVNAIVKLLKDSEFYSKCRHNAIEFSSHLTWDHIFEEAFSQTLSC